jgi:type II secretory pathway pseudopilin PulG
MMRELEFLAQSPDPAVRRQAERDMREAMAQFRMGLGMDDTGHELPDSDQEVGGAQNDEDSDDLETVTSQQGDSDHPEPDVDLGNDDLEWDDLAVRPDTPEQPQGQEININTPGVNISIRPAGTTNTPVSHRSPGSTTTHTPRTPRTPRTPKGRHKADVEDWITTQAEASPVVKTRLGRIVKTPLKYQDEDAIERRRQRQKRQEELDLALAMEQSRIEAEIEAERAALEGAPRTGSPVASGSGLQQPPRKPKAGPKFSKPDYSKVKSKLGIPEKPKSKPSVAKTQTPNRPKSVVSVLSKLKLTPKTARSRSTSSVRGTGRGASSSRMSGARAFSPIDVSEFDPLSLVRPTDQEELDPSLRVGENPFFKPRSSLARTPPPPKSVTEEDENPEVPVLRNEEW